MSTRELIDKELNELPEPICYAKSHGFAEHELRTIERLVLKHQQTLVEAWHDHFNA